MSTCAAGFDDHVDAEVALAFADHALSDRERAEVERRIDACAECRATVAEAARGQATGVATRLDKPSSIPPPVREQRGLAPGDVVGRYIVERPLGAGGMGVVSLARDPELRRAVVIKLVRPDASDDDLEARLRREAQAMAQLSHPNVVQIFDIGRHGDRVFLAMEFIAGQTLDAWLIERERSVDEILAMFLQAGAGLEAAHRAGLLHRDFKPTNVLVDRDGVAKVTDFGLARAIAAPAPAAAPAIPRASGVHAVLTQHDEVIGTPAYMAPEQATGAPLDARTDQFALALALLDALVGQHPTKRRVGPTASATELAAALDKAPPRVRDAIVRALAIAPAARFPDLASFLRELAPPKKKQRWWPLVAGLALCAAAVSTYLAVHREEVKTCVAQAPAAWTTPRQRIEAALRAQPRAFASWHAEHVLGALDNAVADVGAVEVAACKGEAVDTACLDRRRAALAAVSADDPWPGVHAIASCTTEPPTEREHERRADELEATAIAAVARGDFAAAAEAYVGESSTGDLSGDDSLRGRALLGLLDLARVRGDLTAAREQAKQLDALVERHHRGPRDVFTVAIASADAFAELGDVTAAFAAIDRAQDTAATPDDVLLVRSTRARAMQDLRFDPAGAKREIEAALAAPGTSEAAREAATRVAGELALARGEIPPALSHPTTLADRLHDAQVAARAGDVDGALAVLAALAPSDPTAQARTRIARAQILAAAHRNADAEAELATLFSSIRESQYVTKPSQRVGLSAAERTEAWLLRCEVGIELDHTTWCTTPTWLERAHPQAPARARFHLLEVREYERKQDSLFQIPLGDAIDELAAANAEPLMVAGLRLKLVKLAPDHYQRRQHAQLARDAFAAAGRTAEVAELDAILADIASRHPFATSPPKQPPTPPPPGDASNDPWN